MDRWWRTLTLTSTILMFCIISAQQCLTLQTWSIANFILCSVHYWKITDMMLQQSHVWFFSHFRKLWTTGHRWWHFWVSMLTTVCVRPWPQCVPSSVAVSSCLLSAHGSGMKRVIIWPLLSPLSQFDMMNVQFPLSPHSQLITISINKVCPTSVVDIIDQRVTSSDDLPLQWTVDFAKSGLI